MLNVVANNIGKKFFQEKAVEATKQKEEKRKKPKPEEQGGMPQHHCISTALLQSVAEIETPSAMKSSRKTTLQMKLSNAWKVGLLDRCRCGLTRQSYIPGRNK
jgi:hypothetical protein